MIDINKVQRVSVIELLENTINLEGRIRNTTSTFVEREIAISISEIAKALQEICRRFEIK